MSSENVSNEALGMVRDYLDAAKEVLAEHGPQAADLALTVFQLEAIRHSAGSLVGIFVAAGLGYASYRLVLLCAEARHNEEAKEVGGAIGGFICGVLSVVIGIVSLVEITDLAAWVGMFKPEVYMVSKAIGAL